ncbi:TPA: type III secretion system effector arginine glycosyltransferase [Salmonella enterica]|nr:type III secretion system effector arginine glycosyltransferase [Salmonella enterica]
MFSRVRSFISCQHYPHTATSASAISLPLSESANFAGVDYPLLPLNQQTPLVFQWFEQNPGRYGKNQIPIINTQQHPYLNNIINAAIIEKERTIGVFIDGDFSSGQKKALAKLEKQYENIKVIYKTALDYSRYDKKLSTIYLENINTLAIKPVHCQDDYLLSRIKDGLKEILKNNPEETLVSYHDNSYGHVRFDFFRNLFLLKGSNAFLEAGKHGCHHLQPGGGCIYLDTDMLLTGKLGTLHLPEGIAVHVSRKNNSVTLENSIIAVNRSEHPALKKGLEIMHSNAYSDPYYEGICDGLRDYFNCSGVHDYEAFCNFIEFKHENIFMDTSSLTTSSWRSGGCKHTI